MDEVICPFALLNLLLQKRNENITSERLFLTPNPFWKNTNSKGWNKNVPLSTIFIWSKILPLKLNSTSQIIKLPIIQTMFVQYNNS